MKEIIENVILSGNFELTSILKKIDTIWVKGSLSDDDRDSLIKLAQDNALPENTFAPLQKQIDNLANKIIDLEVRVSAIENGSPVDPPVDVDEYPEYIQPGGSYDAYYAGDKVTFDGERYECIAPPGTACVWSPAAYPSFWEKVS